MNGNQDNGGGGNDPARAREEDDNNNDRNVRQRNDALVPRPYGPFRPRDEVSVANLRIKTRTGGGDPVPQNMTIVSLQHFLVEGPSRGSGMVMMVMSITSVGNETSVQQQRGAIGRNQTNIIRHSRKVTLLCPSSPPENNVAIMFHGNGNNQRLFEGDVSLVNDGSLRPGAYVLLRNMPNVEQWLGNGSTPILVSHRPFIVLDNNLEHPERQILSEGVTLNGFINHNTTITLVQVHAINTNCGGELCDHQAIKNGSIIHNRCACFQATNRNGQVMFCMEILVTLQDGSSYNTEFISKYFMKEYIFNASLPSGIRAVQFEDFAVEERLFDAIQGVFNYINNNAGGFRTMGWVRRGEVLDQGVDQPSNGLPYNAQRVMVEAGTLRHHITRLDPMNIDDVDLDVLHRLKFNVAANLG